MTFSEFRAHSEPLFKKLDIMKFQDSIVVNNCLFVYDYLNNNLPGSFINTFLRTNDMHEHKTRQATTGKLYIPSYKTTTFGLKCIYNRCINSWNKLTTELNLLNRTTNVNNIEINDFDLLNYSRTVLKDKLTKHYLLMNDTNNNTEISNLNQSTITAWDQI